MATAFLTPAGRDRAAPIVFCLTVVLPLVLAALILLDGVIRLPGADESAIVWFERLDVMVPALWPSGTPQRHPETLRPFMDLRYSPYLSGFPTAFLDKHHFIDRVEDMSP